MANPHRGEVTFKVDEQSYTLAFSTNAICELEEFLGKGLTAIVANMERITTLRALLWAGLRAKHPDITISKAGDLIDACGIPVAMAVVVQAIHAGFPPQEASSAKN